MLANARGARTGAGQAMQHLSETSLCTASKRVAAWLQGVRKSLVGKLASGRKTLASCLRFLLDGKRLNGDQTPEDVDVEDGDQIDVFQDAFSARMRAAKRPRSSPRQV